MLIGTIDNAVLRSPDDSVLIPCAADIAEGGSTGNFRLACHIVQHLYEHRAGHRNIRCKCRLAHAGEQLVLVSIVDCIVEPVILVDIGKRQRALIGLFNRERIVNGLARCPCGRC